MLRNRAFHEVGKSYRYVYAGDDPVNLVDPSGRDALGCLKDAITGLGAIAVAGFGWIASAIAADGQEAAFLTLIEAFTGTVIEAAAIEATAFILASLIAAWWVLLAAVLVAFIATLVALYISCFLQQ